MTVVQMLGNPGGNASRWLSWNKGERWVLPRGLAQERVAWDPVGGKLLESIWCPQGMGWNGVGSIWRNVFHSLINVSGGDTNICYFKGRVNFLPVPCLKGSGVKTHLAYLALTSYHWARRRKSGILSLFSSPLPWEKALLDDIAASLSYRPVFCFL